MESFAKCFINQFFRINFQPILFWNKVQKIYFQMIPNSFHKNDFVKDTSKLMLKIKYAQTFRRAYEKIRFFGRHCIIIFRIGLPIFKRIGKF